MQENWKIRNEKWSKTFEFESFVSAVDFIQRVTEIAEQLKHHPDLNLFDYKFIRFDLFTHDAAAITDKDRELATEIDRLYHALVR